jgi:nicotinate-nucleotide adenylyltransferase
MASLPPRYRRIQSQIPALLRGSKRRIGLLGGSFNPAHEGHIHISLEARKRLGLDEIWWVLSPHNPLKAASEIEDYALRRNHALKIMEHHPCLRLCEIEHFRHTRYSYDTLRLLHRLAPGLRFVWLMGADNLAGFHRWQRWAELAGETPLAVCDRAPFSHHSLRGVAGTRLAKRRCHRPASLATSTPPAWAFLHFRRHPLSATELRKKLGKSAFFR